MSQDEVWKVITDDDEFITSGTEAYCKEYINQPDRRSLLLEDPSGVIYEISHNGVDVQWEDIAKKWSFLHDNT